MPFRVQGFGKLRWTPVAIRVPQHRRDLGGAAVRQAGSHVWSLVTRTAVATADRYLDANPRRFAGHPSRVALLVDADSRRKGGRGKGLHPRERGRPCRGPKNLVAASTRIPYGERRSIPPWYQLVEACEWLRRMTGRGKYKESALKWARIHRRLDPIQAWAHGVEARLAAEAKSRPRALALTLYLDTNSDHLAGISRDEREKAREWLKSNNPFARDKAMPRAPDDDGPVALPEMPDAPPNPGI